MKKIRAAVTAGDGAFSITELELGAPQENEVLVRIRASGVCHTDWDSMSWKRPLILGHEGAGVVEQTGPGVTHVAPGDRVLLNWAIPCGTCFQCARGAENICEQRPQVPDERFGWPGGRLNASFNLGTMATHAIVPKQAVIRLDVDVPFASAAILGCGVMTGFGSAMNAAKVAPGSSVAVLGCGGVGLSVIQGAAFRGAATIIGVDVNPARLDLARRFGATHTVEARRDDAGLLDAAGEVKGLTSGRGADYAFECTAVPALGSAPLAMVRNGGTAVGVSGIEQVVPINMELFEWDKLYINPLYGQCRPTRDFPLLLDLYAHKRLKLDEMVTRTYTLDQLGEAFHDMHRGVNAKGVLLFD